MFYAAVPQNVASLISRLSSFPFPSDTYLTGGTATTLYIGHRVSVDIDLFTSEHFLTKPIIDAVKESHNVILENIADRDTIIARVDDVRLSLFFYPYKLIKPTKFDSEIKIHIASLEDIAAMKTVAIVQRGTARDFIDLKAILGTTKMPIQELIKITLSKYELENDYSYHIKRGLVFFDDAEKELKDIVLLKDHHLQYPLKKEEWEEVKSFFIRTVMSMS
jgi:predicted nucleotidyltransferase component of viral defense system